ncbi:MAG: hypothetical protein ACYC7D_05435 [Nitrososphaerales archaeon]
MDDEAEKRIFEREKMAFEGMKASLLTNPEYNDKYVAVIDGKKLSILIPIRKYLHCIA